MEQSFGGGVTPIETEPRTFFEALAAVALLALIAVLGLAAWAAWDARRLVLDADYAMQNLNRTVIVAGGAATDLEKTLRAERQASAEQMAAATAAIQNVNAATAQLRVTLDTANTTLAALNTSIEHQDANLTALEAAGTTDLTDLRLSIQSVAAASQSVQELAAQPSWAESGDNLAAATKSLAGVSANLDATTADVRAFAHRELAPVRGAWNVVKGFLMEFAGPAAQVATAAK